MFGDIGSYASYVRDTMSGMYRAPLARALAAICMTFSLLSVMFVPALVNAEAEGNICKVANTQCGPQSNGKTPCLCVIPAGATTYLIKGLCVKEHDCKYTPASAAMAAPSGWVPGNADVSIFGSTNYTVADLPFEAQNAINSANGSLLKDIGAFIKDNPLISGLGLGAGMSLLQSLMSPSGSGSGSSGGNNLYSSGGCTTQYYYTSNANALTDPCAIYSPNAADNTTGTQSATDNTLGNLLNNLNASNTPGISIPSSTVGSLSPYLPIATIDTTGSSSIAQPSLTITTPDTIATDTGPQPVPVSDLLNGTQYYTNATDASTPSASQTPLNQNPVPVPTNGIHGDIKSFGGGATIYASSRSGNTEVSGFFGSTAGGTSKSAAGSLCQVRPWNSNFLSYIIPPTFFDNLCSLGGYPVGAVQVVSSGAGNNGASTGGGSKNVSVPAPKSVTTYSNPVVAQAKIWARPASVSLGGRTTIFWTSENVTSCSESSSDGNFSGSSPSGGASTVALSGATTFRIECNTIDGKTVSDSTTVQIGI